MIYSYIRVSTDKQTAAIQQFEINAFLKKKSLVADRTIQETASGTIGFEYRKIGNLIKRAKSGDIIVVSEISRLGRNLMQIMTILNLCMSKKVKIISIKENYELGDNLNSKVLAFAFGLSAEIERELISARTRESLARLKSKGIKLGRPRGSGTVFNKLRSNSELIKKLISRGNSRTNIAKRLGVSRTSLASFLKKY